MHLGNGFLGISSRSQLSCYESERCSCCNVDELAFGFVCTQFTSVGIRQLGYKFYVMFAVFNIAFLPVVYFLYPETANRTLEDLDDYFDKDSPHKIPIPFSDKVAKQHQRPAEAVEAELRRIALATDSKRVDRKDSADATFIEEVAVEPVTK